MSNTEEYLRTLNKDELIAIVIGMERFTDGCDCPLDVCGSLRDAPMRCEEECNSDIHLCWCKYFVWQRGNQKREELKCQNRKN